MAGIVGLVCQSVSEWISIVHRYAGNFLIKPKAEEYENPVLAEAHWYFEQVEKHARYLRAMSNRTMEDLDIDEADVEWVFGSSLRVPGHVLEDHSSATTGT